MSNNPPNPHGNRGGRAGHAGNDADADADVEESDSGMAQASELFVTRDENDELQTVKKTVGGFGEVEIRPIVYGQSERYFGDAGGVAMVGPSVIAEILSNHVVDPDLNEYVRSNDDWGENSLTERVVAEEMQAFAPMVLVSAILEASGLSNVDVQMDDKGNAQVDFDNDAEGK